MTAKVDGRKYEGMATVGVDETRIRPTTVNPEDFDAFWTGAIAEARKQPLDPKMTLLPERCTSTQNVYHVSFQNERPGSRIYGILIVPKKLVNIRRSSRFQERAYVLITDSIWEKISLRWRLEYMVFL